MQFPRVFDQAESPQQALPTMYDLPSENPEEPGLPDVRAGATKDEFHNLQPQLLSATFRPPTMTEGKSSRAQISTSTTLLNIPSGTNAQIGLVSSVFLDYTKGEICV
jgi:hypothetical protein